MAVINISSNKSSYVTHLEAASNTSLHQTQGCQFFSPGGGETQQGLQQIEVLKMPSKPLVKIFQTISNGKKGRSSIENASLSQFCRANKVTNTGQRQ